MAVAVAFDFIHRPLFNWNRIAVWQGRVAVFEGAEPLPSTVLETPVDSLPPADQQALERGIPVGSREELAGLLEDYGS